MIINLSIKIGEVDSLMTAGKEGKRKRMTFDSTNFGKKCSAV